MGVCVKSFRVCSISALVFFLYHVSYVSPVIIRFSVFQELYIVHIAVCTECTEVSSVCTHTERFILFVGELLFLLILSFGSRIFYACCLYFFSPFCFVFEKKSH